MTSPVSFESLDHRTFLNAALTTPLVAPRDLAQLEIRGDVLFVAGTHKDDRITITRDIDSLRAIDPTRLVSLRFERAEDGTNSLRLIPSLAEGVTTDRLMIQTAKNTYVADVFGINRIQLNGGEGNDTLRIGKNVRMRVDVRGAGGNDWLEAGSNKDILRGGAGDDTMINVVTITDYNRYQGGDGHDLFLTSRPANRFNAQIDEIGGAETFRYIDPG